MKITSSKEVKVEKAIINITIDPTKQKTTMELSYTCPHCAGWGCGKHGGTKHCNNGTVEQKLEPSKLNQVFEEDDLVKVKAAIKDLYSKVMGK